MQESKDDARSKFWRTQFWTGQHWTLIQRAGSSQSPEEKRQALSELLEVFSPAFERFLIKGNHIDEHQAKELVRGFVTEKMVERHMISRADKQSGTRFRLFLDVSLWHYCREEFKKAGEL